LNATAQLSAGLLVFRRQPRLQVLLVHPGGPYWVRKDNGAWSIPKGLVDPGEDALAAARRELQEETGFDANGGFRSLGSFLLYRGKYLEAWSIEGDFDLRMLASNSFQIEWPPKSGKMKFFPEVDRAGWFERAAALRKIAIGQRQVIQKFFSREKNTHCTSYRRGRA
jgi:predicted NUDIX family NTP pyrophosphohydrolase